MPTRPPLRQTHTYAELPISPSSYEDIRNRILAIDAGLSTADKPCHDYRDEYMPDFGKPDEAIIFGTVGLTKDLNTSSDDKPHPYCNAWIQKHKPREPYPRTCKECRMGPCLHKEI